MSALGLGLGIPFVKRSAVGGGGGGISCHYALDNTTGAQFGYSAWPTFDGAVPSAEFTLNAATTAQYGAIPTVEAGPTPTGVVPITGSRVYYFEFGVSAPAIVLTGTGSDHRIGMNLLNTATFTEVKIYASGGVSTRSLAYAVAGETVVGDLGAAALTDYRIGVYVDSATGKIGLVGASDYGYMADAPLSGAAGYVIGLYGGQTTPDETGTCGVRLYTNAADFTRTPPVGARDICGNVI